MVKLRSSVPDDFFNNESLPDKGKIEALSPKSKALKTTRKRSWDYRILEEIKSIRDRENHPNLGAKKIYSLLLTFTKENNIPKCPKPITIERLIKDMGWRRVFPQKISYFGKIKKANRKKVLRKPKDLTPTCPRPCFSFGYH